MMAIMQINLYLVTFPGPTKVEVSEALWKNE